MGYKFIANSNKKTYPLGKQGSNSCSALGMRVWSTFAAKAQATAVAHVKNHLKENANTNEALLDFLNICVPASVVNAVKANHFATSGRAANKYQVSRISNAEVGKYVITYTVADKAGNTNTEIRNGRKYSMQGNVRNGPGVDCSKPNNSGNNLCKCDFCHSNGIKKDCNIKRTVVVKDTIPPVITLHLKGSLIHESASDQTGIGGESNPAGKKRGSIKGYPHRGNPYLMAEEQSSTATNGWIIDAAASAVTGLALLGYSQRKSTVTTVPV